MSKFILVFLVLAAAVCGIQSVLFAKTSRRILHFLPLIVIGAVYLTAFGLYLSDLNRNGGVLMNTIFAYVIAIFNTSALVGDGIAWLIEKV